MHIALAHELKAVLFNFPQHKGYIGSTEQEHHIPLLHRQGRQTEISIASSNEASVECLIEDSTIDCLETRILFLSVPHLEIDIIFIDVVSEDVGCGVRDA